MKRFSWNTRRRWIVIFYAVFIIAIIFSIVLSNFSNSKESMTAEIEQSQEAILSQLSQNIELRLAYIDKFLISMCERQEVSGYFEGEQQTSEMLRTLRADASALAGSDSSVESVYLYPFAQDSVITNEGVFGKEGFYDGAWLEKTEELTKRRTVWTLPRRVQNPESVNPDENIFSMLKTYPLITTPEKISGYVVININEDMLTQIVAETMQAINSIFMILDKDGNVLARSRNYFTYDENELFEKTEGMRNLSTTVTIGGKHFFVKEKSFDSTEWRLISVSPYGSVLDRLKAFRRSNIFMAFAVSIFMFLVIVITNKWMNAPVDQIMELIVRNVEKDENHKINNIEELGNMFMYMVTQQQDLQKQLDVNIPFIKYQLITRMVSNQSVTYDEISPQLSLIKARLYQNNYIVMLADLDNKDIIDMKSPGAGFDIYISSLYNKAEELINQENKGFATQLPNRMCMMLLSFEKDDARSNTIKALEIAELLSNFMRDYYNVSITTGVGEYYSDFSGIAKSYEEAVALIKYKSIVGTGRIITKEDIQLVGEANTQKNNVIRDKLMRAFESGSRQQTFALLDELFGAMKEGKLASDSIIQISMQLVRSCLEHYAAEGFEISSDHYKNIDISLNQLETADEIKTFIGHLFDEMLTELNEKKSVKNADDMVLRIVEYVDSSYAEYNMSLNLLADKFGLSVPYLSKIFKAYTQKTFTEYLIEIRIRKATELLVNSNKKVNEIASEVGYPNPSSFIRIFKKYYYMTPVDYRNRHRIIE